MSKIEWALRGRITKSQKNVRCSCLWHSWPLPFTFHFSKPLFGLTGRYNSLHIGFGLQSQLIQKITSKKPAKFFIEDWGKRQLQVTCLLFLITFSKLMENSYVHKGLFYNQLRKNMLTNFIPEKPNKVMVIFKENNISFQGTSTFVN